jgi:hypothetical protein
MTFDKNKVYTALNADEVKIGSKGYFADSLMLLKELVDVEAPINSVCKIEEEDFSHRFISNAEVKNHALFYLVETPQAYRPYENTDELIEDFKERVKKRYNVNFCKCPMFSPTIWIKDKRSNTKYLISALYETTVYLSGVDEYYLESLFEDFTYLDGSPCGKKI